MYLIAGANLFGQWLSEDCVIKKFRNFTFHNKNNSDCNIKEPLLCCVCWSYNIFKIHKLFYVTGSWQGKENQNIRLNLPKECENINEDNLTMVGNDYNLILVDKKSLTVWIINLQSQEIKRFNLNIERPLSPQDSLHKRLKSDESVIKIVANNNTCLYLTSKGMVYSGMMPSLLDTSHCEGKVCDVQCGYEHCILLTDAGRVYTWGNGRRLQLGHGDLNNLETPTEVEALAGIRITKIRAGGWHSFALSEFGDLYAWGWNDTGQLGIKFQPGQTENEEGSKSFTLPTLVDLFNENNEEVSVNVKDIACGSRHSVILLEDNTVWTTGYNKYGQLGFLPELNPSIDSFKRTYKCENNVEVMCGPWCTILYSKVF